MANALWVADHFEPKKEYIDSAQTYYDSTVEKVDFVSDSGANTINDWVKKHTENKIAAMSPRFLGCAAVITKRFARIHETNLKKQGILALTFSSDDDYDKIKEDAKISLIGLDRLEPQRSVTGIVTHSDGTKHEIVLNHSYNQAQIEWFKAGSALNILREK